MYSKKYPPAIKASDIPDKDVMTQMIRNEWFTVQNGAQIDIHVRVTPPNETPRELVIASNVAWQVAKWLVDQHNRKLS